MFNVIVQKLRERNINTIVVNNKEEACEKAHEIISKNATIGFGGSRTLEEIGILEILRSGKYKLLDRTKFPK
jgi:L-lactate utilization protein LutB